MSVVTRALVWISGATSGIGAALAATIPFDADVIDLSRRGDTPGTHHVAVDLAEPRNWPLAEHDYAGWLASLQGDPAAYLPDAGPDEVDSIEYPHNVLVDSGATQVLGQSCPYGVADLDHDKHLVMISSGASQRRAASRRPITRPRTQVLGALVVPQVGRAPPTRAA